jgi:sensor histidine kinase regulating citrate/malate metabolism
MARLTQQFHDAAEGIFVVIEDEDAVRQFHAEGGSVGKRSADGATGNLAAISESARRALSIL